MATCAVSGSQESSRPFLANPSGLVDLKIRKTMPYPPEIFAGIEAAVKAHSTLDGEALVVE
jgi:hypothetical protein